MKILDIDLDFFLNNKHTGTTTGVKRLDDEYYKPWSAEQTVHFLEFNCGLSPNKKIKGKVFIHHDEVFYYLRDLQIKSNFANQFIIDHVDAHADLGTGDASYKYISSEILFQPLHKRCYPEKTNGFEGLSAGNYLAFLIACRWVERLNYINNADWIDDLQWFNFKDFEPSSEVIQLKKFSADQMKQIIFGMGMYEEAIKMKPLEFEPEVPFQAIDSTSFLSNGDYDLIFLTQSPGFTPLASDMLIPVIKEYMDIIPFNNLKLD